jgi:hypothetical protein
MTPTPSAETQSRKLRLTMKRMKANRSRAESANCCGAAIRWSLLKLRLLFDVEGRTRRLGSLFNG